MRTRSSLRAKKHFGQHFLQPVWADRVVQAIDPRSTDRFLEIGPGPGVADRTPGAQGCSPDRRRARSRHGGSAQAEAAVERVARRARLPRFRPAPGGSQQLRVAGNLPYNVSSPILFKLLRARREGVALADATLMVQREVADRIEGSPGTKDYGTLAIFVQLRATVRRVLTLPPGAFRPIPKVHSAVLRLDFREPEVTMKDEATFERLVRSIFTQRRKTLLNALKPFAEERAISPRVAVAAAGVDGSRRPETLQLAELARLADVFVSSLT